MKSIARMLELSVASNEEAFGQKDIRRGDIDGIPNSFKRRVASVIDTFAAQHPEGATTSLDVMARMLAGMRFIGQGADFSVYTDGLIARKIHRKSALWNSYEREAFMQKTKSGTDMVCGALGPMAISQTYRAGDHIFGGYKVVMAEQPLVDGITLPIFNTNSSEINRGVASSFCEDTTDGEAALLQIVLGTYDLYDSDALVPDTNGNGNFVTVGNERRLHLLDPIPVTDTPTVQLVMRQVDNLADFLAA